MNHSFGTVYADLIKEQSDFWAYVLLTISWVLSLGFGWVGVLWFWGGVCLGFFSCLVFFIFFFSPQLKLNLKLPRLLMEFSVCFFQDL